MLPFQDISARFNIQLAMTPNTVSGAGLDIAGSLETAVEGHSSRSSRGRGPGRVFAGSWRPVATPA